MEIPKITLIQRSPVVDSGNSQSNQNQSKQHIENGKKSTEERLNDAVKNLNQVAEQSQIYLNFKLHEKSGEYYVQMIDSKTNDVIREIPSKKLLDYFTNLKGFLGLMVDEQI